MASRTGARGHGGRRTRRHAVVLLGLAVGALPVGCYESFDKIGQNGSATGGTGAGNGMGGRDAGPVTAQDDEFRILQGGRVQIEGPGLLENDLGEDLQIVFAEPDVDAIPEPLRPVAFGVEDSGSFALEPAEDFWGVIEVPYTVEDPDGNQSSAVARVSVTPLRIDLAYVAEGYGGFIIDGASGDELGAALHAAGDVNGDGVDDLLLGAPQRAAAGVGRALVVFGSADIGPLDLSDSPAAQVAVLQGSGENLCAGSALAGGEDVNGDDVDDLLVGEPGCSNSPGAAYVVFGGSSFAGLQLATLSEQQGYAMTGSGTASVGKLVALGDVNGDDLSDALVSSRDSAAVASNDGSLHVVFGPGSGGELGAVSQLRVDGTSAQQLPSDVAALGDLTGDGRSDVLLTLWDGVALLKGASLSGDPPNDWPPTLANVSDSGNVFGWKGLAKGWGSGSRAGRAGDFDGDGKRDLVYCSPSGSCSLIFGPPQSVATADWTIEGFTAGPDVSGDLDLNGDGFAELLFANGSAYVVWGRQAIPSSALQVDELGEAGVLFEPEQAGLQSIARVGDVDADGSGDFAIAAPSSASNAGRVYVLSGALFR